MKVPYFTGTSRKIKTNFSCIFYKFTHFHFSCSPYIYLKSRQLHAQFNSNSRILFIRTWQLCNIRFIRKLRANRPCSFLLGRETGCSLIRAKGDAIFVEGLCCCWSQSLFIGKLQKGIVDIVPYFGTYLLFIAGWKVILLLNVYKVSLTELNLEIIWASGSAYCSGRARRPANRSMQVSPEVLIRTVFLALAMIYEVCNKVRKSQRANLNDSDI